MSGVAERSSTSSQVDATDSLSWYARELYNDLRLAPMLRQLMRTSCRLVEAAGGSISLVDAGSWRYTKVAEVGTACRLGQSFALHEGVTGQVVRHRRPVVLESYRQIASGHLPSGHPASEGAVVAIPIWWRGDIVAVNVVFAGVARPFTTAQVDRLELVTQVVAPGVVTAVQREVPDGMGLRDRAAAVAPPPSHHETASRVSVEHVVLDLLDLAERAEVGCRSSQASVEVTVVTGGDRPRLLLRHANLPLEDGTVRGAGRSAWAELVDDHDGVTVQEVVDSHTAGSTDLEEPSAQTAAAPGPPFSAREQEVLTLLARGFSDRAAAAALCLSPKTVEKHVSAVLRKTGTKSRTAAVVHCIEHGWLPMSDSASV